MTASLGRASDVKVEASQSRPPKPPSHTATRQFSFQTTSYQPQQAHDGAGDDDYNDGSGARPRSRLGLGSRQSSHTKTSLPFKATAEEEERLVKGEVSTEPLGPPSPSSPSSDSDDDTQRW